MVLLCALILHLLALLAGGRPVVQPKEEPSFDAVISLQGSRPVDTDGNEVRRPAGTACAQLGRHHRAAPASPPLTRSLPPCTCRCMLTVASS